MSAYTRAHKMGYKDGVHQELEQNTLTQLAAAHKRIIREATNSSMINKEEFVSKLDGSFEKKIEAAYVIGYECGYKEELKKIRDNEDE